MRMERQEFEMDGRTCRLYEYDTLVVGSGAAGFSAADRLFQYGQTGTALVTEGICSGTSRNTGSDKQTYYKLSLAGDEPDSINAMARDFFSGQCVDGDHALCEAALSVQCFMHLVELGVPFPQNHFGEYVGYKTDHDPGRRATSAGPYTSKIMTECLQRQVEKKNIPILSHRQAVRILTAEGAVRGLLCLNRRRGQWEIFACRNLVFATGAPAGMYAENAYPPGQYGATGLLLEAGAVGKNLTEWQFGMSSLRPRWNVSGTYMQALPRFVSTEPDGSSPREFLREYFSSEGEMLSAVFLKGYQWPFDAGKAAGKSSLLDLVVYEECHGRGRRVFLDYRENPGGGKLDFQSLCPEAFTYLERGQACFGRPVERLKQMNLPAYEFFLEKGVDLEKDMVEIAVCAQHNNGGISVDAWWQSCVSGLFVIGEAAGTHGVCRLGGSALNAGQAGALRAARYISAHRGRPVDGEEVVRECGKQIREVFCLADQAKKPGKEPLGKVWKRASERMSRAGAILRSEKEIEKALRETIQEFAAFPDRVGMEHERQLGYWFRLRETLLCQLVYLGAMEDYICQGGKSRGSALYQDPAGILPVKGLPEAFRFQTDNGEKGASIQEAVWQDGKAIYNWRPVRPLPRPDNFFENIWKEYRSYGSRGGEKRT